MHCTGRQCAIWGISTISGECTWASVCVLRMHGTKLSQGSSDGVPRSDESARLGIQGQVARFGTISHSPPSHGCQTSFPSDDHAQVDTAPLVLSHSMESCFAYAHCSYTTTTIIFFQNRNTTCTAPATPGTRQSGPLAARIHGAMPAVYQALHQRGRE